MDWGSVKIHNALSFTTSRPTVDRHMKAARRDAGELLSYREGEKARDITETLRRSVPPDLMDLRGKANTMLAKAIKDDDPESFLIWFREATHNAEARSRHLKAFDILIDASTTNTTINVEQVQGDTARKIFADPLLCPGCGEDVSGPLLAKHIPKEGG